MKKIYDYHKDEQIELYVLIKSADEKTTRTNKPYLSFVFQDISGEISANYWDATPKDVEMFKPGTVIKLEGKREEYKGSPQIRIKSIRPTGNDEPNNPELYVERAPINKDKMVEEFNHALFDITNANMNRIVRFIMKKYQHDFFQSPAAKTNHHAFMGGLAYHTVSMLRIARSLTDIYTELDVSLLFSGVILHDVGKVIELSGPTATDYTLEGKLIGHIVMINEDIVKACKELKIDEANEDVLLLKHIVLAHHGELEYGSPVRPLIPEAEMLHYIDQIDAKMNMISQALTKTEPGEFSDRVWAMNNRSFYKKTYINPEKSTD
ncbi:MAG: 3'-5' exoribonuclease YhaM family protein [Alkalibacterium gilvum]|uniref:3'-5' exoribonuclease n=1 Tax=Alkalibacterium gilvum TaxID=1130080 RepID=A0A1H6V5D8_9LACT|nr:MULTISPECIES: HD domain-containing protein [Alkalibacterium]MDN6294984.1 HD domain-containing protein [Alkalibacterium sp.]MDN6398200.1 HD domain-containing protein [Alkalibacterium sp.]SEI99738.1 3'-5' exoribonuclease [Alkalibacterium gilvum]HAJ69894.1 HD domain-containing protein [Alkalibacterium sp.]